MDNLITLGLPLALAVIMLSLGVGLEPGDFARVLRRRRAFGLGALAQVVGLPLMAFTVLSLFPLPPELAVGIMLLSLCPGGVTSNMLSKLSHGDVALSVTLTAVVSLLSLVTVPILAAWAVRHFLGEAAPEISVAGIALAVFLITTLPVLAGVTLRHRARALALRIEPGLSRAATVLFVLVVLGALAANWSVFVENVTVMGEALIVLNLVLICAGLALAHAGGLSWREMKTISIETGIQNAAMGITLAGVISGVSEGFSPMALPSAVYGITMYAVAAPFVAWFRHRGRD